MKYNDLKKKKTTTQELSHPPLCALMGIGRRRWGDSDDFKAAGIWVSPQSEPRRNIQKKSR